MAEHVESDLNFPSWFTRKEGNTLCTTRPPDNIGDVWDNIIHHSVNNGKYNFKDVCCVSMGCKVMKVGEDDGVWSKLYFDQFRSPYNGKPPVKTAFKRRFKRTKRAVERVRYHREMSHGLNEITSWMMDGCESLNQRARSMGYAKETLICQGRRAAAARGEAALKSALELVQSEQKHFLYRHMLESAYESDARTESRELRMFYDG